VVGRAAGPGAKVAGCSGAEMFCPRAFDPPLHANNPDTIAIAVMLRIWPPSELKLLETSCQP
jgi:hypothetical protein